MNPQHFRLRSQVDSALQAGLLANAARPKALQQAISAGERAQAQQIMLSLLQANVLHRTKSILSPPVATPDEAMAVPKVLATGEDTLPVLLSEPLAVATDVSPLGDLEHIAPQLRVLDNALATLEPVTSDTASLVAEENVPIRTVVDAPQAAGQQTLWLLVLAIAIAIGVTIWAGWLAALAWVGLAGIGMGLVIATRSKRHHRPHY